MFYVETLNKYKQLLNVELNKIVYSLADILFDEEDVSIYSHIEFFDKIFCGTNSKLGFHYTISKDSINMMKQVITNTLSSFDNRQYFDKISLLRFVPHGKGINEW